MYNSYTRSDVLAIRRVVRMRLSAVIVSFTCAVHWRLVNQQVTFRTAKSRVEKASDGRDILCLSLLTFDDVSCPVPPARPSWPSLAAHIVSPSCSLLELIFRDDLIGTTTFGRKYSIYYLKNSCGSIRDGQSLVSDFDTMTLIGVR
jgi:hypothetical protein